MSPRDADNLGVFVYPQSTWIRPCRYDSPDGETTYDAPEDIAALLADGAIVIPFRVYSDGDIVETDPEDATGYYYAERSAILAEYGRRIMTRATRDAATSTLRAEFDEYRHYLSGDNWVIFVTCPITGREDVMGSYSCDSRSEWMLDIAREMAESLAASVARDASLAAARIADAARDGAISALMA